MEVTVKYLQVDPKTGVLRYRRPFPADLRPYVGEGGKPLSELKVTLGARSITEPGAMQRFQDAASRYASMAARAEKLRSGAFDALDDSTIARFAGIVRSDGLGLDAEARLVREPIERKRARARGLSETCRADLDECRELRALGDIEGMVAFWGDQAESLSELEGLVVDRSSDEFARLCSEINDAQIDVWEGILSRNGGDSVSTPIYPESRRTTVKAVDSSRSVEAIILELIDKPRLDFKEPTKERVRGALRFLKEAVGELTPAELTRERVTHYLDLLAQRPSKLPKGDCRLTLPELAKQYGEKPEVPRLTQKTLEAYCLALNARWKEAQGEGAIPSSLPSPFGDRKFRRSAGGPKAAKGFDQAELESYLRLPVFQSGERPTGGKGETVFWLPLVAMFTGARPEEVAQLLVADIFPHERDGKWVIRFTDEGFHPTKGRQSLKTEGQESGRRTFPIPQALLDLGLIDYRRHLARRGELALFPGLRRKGKRTGIYASFGEWMCEYVYDHGVLPRGAGRQPVREFRHTWTTAARASKIPREAQEYIQGHKAPGGGSAHETYGERDDLGDWIAGLKFRVDVLALVARWKPPAV